MATVVLSGCSAPLSTPASTGARPTAAASVAAMSLSHCGQGWSRATTGALHLQIHNVDTAAGEAYLDTSDGAILAEADPVGPGSWGTLDAVLGPGTYHLVCTMDDADPVTGPAITVTGAAEPGSPQVHPVTSGDLAPYAIADSRRIAGRLLTLHTQSRELGAALAAGDRTRAERAWRSAYLTWNTLGVAYGAFGAGADKVAGLPYGLPLGVADPGWTGLHRIEYGLWHGQPLSHLAALGERLTGDVAALRTTVQQTELDPGEMVLRTHEIAEQSMQQTLSGVDDFGSDTTTAAVAEQLTATQELLTSLRRLLAPRYPDLARTEELLQQTHSAAAAIPAWQRATRKQRETLDADLSGLCELLASVATILEPRVAS